jgi:hypothetical protein
MQFLIRDIYFLRRQSGASLALPASPWASKKESRMYRFFLTLIFHETIPSLAAMKLLQRRRLLTRENRQMATKKAAAKKPAKKAAKKATKKK